MWFPATTTRSPLAVIPAPDRHVNWSWWRRLPQSPSALLLSPGTGVPLSTMRCRFCRTDTTSAVMVMSLPDRADVDSAVAVDDE